ncbi:arginase family enzyme/GNAT superfamily N-acetyltransferase [Streptosporangium album]|uniref:Arginase family enzyme/GNAT superfamily N-acetyltransferase n=1 Tax=Streptosporangium album TaxID=47479 RepID=A0A7W7S2Z5_9ACTN|nr:GNAT family N-acetyltransferase [Streptosporangium album]MBB4942955.1 arginase family enzyme/GNAT superfamily N-acetyltransferase [Streptosporangium album]
MSQVTVVEVPQWQGSSSPAAVRLAEGAARLAAMIPDAEHLRVTIGETLAETAARTREALSRARGGFTVTVGGDCGVELEPISAALREYGERLRVVWFDAHGDLNTPDSSPSGAFHGMVLRTLLGEGPPDLVPDRVLRPEQVVLAGVRALDPAESEYVRVTGLGDLSALADGAALYIHLDLDVLDPEFFGSVGTPEPGGLLPGELTDQIAALASRFEVVGLGVTEYEPARPQDDDLLAKLVPELVTLCGASAAWQIERRAAQAWPASFTEDREGWLLRHTPGGGWKRSNSALPLLGRTTTVDEVEAFYRERGQPACVQVSPAEHHRSLDAALAARGYALTGKTLVLTASTADVIAETTSTIPVETVDDPARWPRLFAGLDGRPASSEVIARIASPTALLAVDTAGRTAGMGLFVADSGWAGIFCMATHPDHRRRGVATAILGAGARWAAGQGAERLYLQVEEHNETARNLYARIGFTPSHTYHYRQ